MEVLLYLFVLWLVLLVFFYYLLRISDCFLLLSWLLAVLAPTARGQHLVGVDAGAIVRRDLEGRGAMYVVKGQQNILDVDYDYQTGRPYVHAAHEYDKGFNALN